MPLDYGWVTKTGVKCYPVGDVYSFLVASVEATSCLCRLGSNVASYVYMQTYVRIKDDLGNV